MSDKPTPEDEALVRQYADKLIEHFDSVQIFVSKRVEVEDTASLAIGAGNWFARYGQIKDWIIRKEREM